METAEKGITTFDAILTHKTEIAAFSRGSSSPSHHIYKIIEALYQIPVLDAQKAAEIADVSLRTGNKII